MANKDITETGVRSVLETMGIPSSFQGFKDNAIGRVEAAATVGSSMAGTMAGMGGSIFELMRSGNPQAALDQYRQIQEAMTYMPRTQAGLEDVQQIGEFFEPVGQLYEQYGESVGESTGSPLAGEYAEEFLDPLFFLSGIGAIPKRASRVADAATDAADVAADAVYLYDLLDDGEELITHSGGKIDDIRREGVFDGIFGKYGDFSEYGNPGEFQTSFAVKADKIAGRGDFDFDYDKSMEFLRKEFPEATGDEIDDLYSAIAEDDFSPSDNNVLERFGFDDPGEASFEAQRLRGKMASDQGFDAVAMSDESGTSYLLPFGSKAKKIAENGIPIADAATDAADVAADAVPAIKPIVARGGMEVQPAKEGARAHGLPTELLIEGPKDKPITPVVQTFTPANTDKVLSNIEQVKAQNPDALSSAENWVKMEDDAFGGDFVPAPPMMAIDYAQSPDLLAQKLQQLTPELKAGVDEGFGYVQDIRNLYSTEAPDLALTGRLFLWGILSRGAGPVQQESAFIDLIEKAQPYIDKAVQGEFSDADLDSWKSMVSESLPEGSPSRQVTMNANAAGKLLMELSKRPEGSNQTVLSSLHNILADPNASGRDFRKEFFRLTDKPGIDNKVVSFIGLVGGKDDMLVMDRIQSRHLWDDGRYEGRNIYDGIDKGGLSAILGGPRGLLLTESMEDGLRGPVAQAYEMIGRPEDASVGRMHWETWVIEGNQAVSHSTLESVRTGSQVGGAVTEGKPGTFSSGMTYRQTVSGPISEYPLSDGSAVRMTPERQKEFESYIKTPKNGIIPKGFKVSAATNRPWYEMQGVDRRKLDEAARQFENANADGSLKSGAPRVEQGGRTVSQRRGDFLRAISADRAARSGRAGAEDSGSASGPYIREPQKDDGTVGLLTLTPSPKTSQSYQYAGLSTPVIRQVDSASNASAYNAEMSAALRDNPMAPQVEIKSPEELANMRLFKTDAGSGFAIKPDGDIVAVYATPDEPRGGSYAMLQAAVEAGGRKLDAFNTYLPDIYETVGFRPVAKVKWNDEYAPSGWDKEVFKEYQNGEPDVAFFVYDPDYKGTNGIDNIPYVDDYDDAVALQNAEVRKLEFRVKQVLGE